MWVYRMRRRKAAPPADPGIFDEVFEVGFWQPHGEWEFVCVKQFDYEAAAIVCYLNGGAEPQGSWTL
jgi:hypothetical protein